MTSAADPSRCPLCGDRNDCAMIDGGLNCWCIGHPIPAEVLARLAPGAWPAACVCRSCADGEDPHRRLEQMHGFLRRHR